MTVRIDGQVFYDFADLAEEYGEEVAEMVFARIRSESGRWIDTVTGEISEETPTPLDEGTLFDETGWIDLCDCAEEVSAVHRNSFSSAVWRLHHAAWLRSRLGV